METVREQHKSIKLKSIDNLKPQNNYVLCKRVGNNLTATTNAGIQKVTASFHRDQYVPQNVERVFEVAKLPEKLEDKHGFWRTQIDIKVGDLVIVEYFESQFSKVIMVGEDEYRFILYYKIITKIEPNNVIPINGYVLFTTMNLKYSDSIIMPEIAKVQDPRYGIIEYVSPPNSYYLRDGGGNFDKGIEVNKGDKVIFVVPLNKFAPILENKVHKILDKEYCYCHRFRIGGKFS